jgi:hypothetical protein
VREIQTSGRVASLASDADGNWLAVGLSEVGKVRARGGAALYHAASGACLFDTGTLGMPVQAVGFVPGTSEFVAAGASSRVVALAPSGGAAPRVAEAAAARMQGVWAVAGDPRTGIFALAGESPVVDVRISLGSRTFGVSVLDDEAAQL